ncbi:MAG: hypothetical protein QXG05_04680 [Nitrososphaerota archaeon]
MSSLEVPFEDFARYMEKKKDTYTVLYEGDDVKIIFYGSSSTIVDKLGKPVTITILAKRIGSMVRFKSMQAEIGDEVFEGSVGSLESWLLEIKGEL